jgi:hypothetical protein
MSDHSAASMPGDHAVDIDHHVKVYIIVFVALMTSIITSRSTSSCSSR